MYQKLRQVFAENELPSKAVRDSLSKELSLDPEKVTLRPIKVILRIFFRTWEWKLIRLIHIANQYLVSLVMFWLAVRLNFIFQVSKWFKNARYMALRNRRVNSSLLASFSHMNTVWIPSETSYHEINHLAHSFPIYRRRA